jgi:hypothetical protein
VRFFHSAEDAKSLAKHISNLDEIIRGATVGPLAPLRTVVAAAHMGVFVQSSLFPLILMNE